MKQTIIIIGLLIALGLGYFAAPARFGAYTTSSQMLTGTVWAINATTTNQTWNVMEVSGNLYSAAVNSKVSVSSTAKQILAGNGGAVIRSVCNEGTTNGYLTIGSTVTTTVTASNYFTTSTGRLVPAGTCYDFR